MNTLTFIDLIIKEYPYIKRKLAEKKGIIGHEVVEKILDNKATVSDSCKYLMGNMQRAISQEYGNNVEVIYSIQPHFDDREVVAIVAEIFDRS